MSSCPTGKVRYRDELGAKFVMTLRPPRWHERAQLRAYRCPQCRGWHLTSAIKRKVGGRR